MCIYKRKCLLYITSTHVLRLFWLWVGLNHVTVPVSLQRRGNCQEIEANKLWIRDLIYQVYSLLRFACFKTFQV